MRKINKTKLVIRIIELLIILATIILTPIAIKYTTILRGYKAVGGEYLLPILCLVIILILESILEEIKNRKEKQWKK